MNQERTKHRITRHLQSVADETTIPESSPDTARRRARQRTVTRRRSVTAGLAAASVAGVIAGVSILSTPASTTVQTSDEVTAPQADPDIAESEVTTNAVTVPPSAPTAPGAIQRDAVAADPALVWKVVEPGKDNSVNGAYSGGSVSRFPTLIVSTAPGRSNDDDNIETVVWQTDDGVEFTRSDLSSPFPGDFWQPQFVGDDVFSVGTAPGVAVGDPNPLQVAVNAVSGSDAEWRSVDLPLDTNEFLAVPMAYGSLEVARIELDDRLLVAATPRLSPDYEAVARSQGLEPNTYSYWNEADRGIEYADAECVSQNDEFFGQVPPTTVAYPADESVATDATEDAVEAAPDSAAGVAEVLATTPFAPAPAGENGSDEECPMQYISWEDAGVPAETIAAFDAAATRFFTVDSDLNVAEIESPSPGTNFQTFGFGNDARFFDPDSEAARAASFGSGDVVLPFFEFDGVSFVEGEMPSVNWGSDPSGFGDGVAGMSYTDSGSRFTVLDAENTVTEVDLRPILGGTTRISDGSPGSATVGDGRLVSVVAEYDDPIAEAGGVEATVDGVTIRRESVDSNVVFIDEATGAPIADDRIVFDRYGGRSVLAADGSVIAEFSEEQTYNDLEGQVDMSGQDVGHFSILTTADGEAFTVESIAELAGLDDTDINWVPRIVSDGTTVTVTVTLNERYEDDTRKQLVLVGTPIG